MAERLSFGRAARRIVLVAAGALLAGCSSGPDPVAVRWLSQNCSVGERGRLELALRNEGTRAEVTLVAAYERGPDNASLDAVVVEAGREYDEVASALDAGRSYGLTASEIASIRAISREEHVRRARVEFERDYRAAAISGLGVLSLRRGLELLHRIVSDAQSADREFAAAALNLAAASPPSP